LWRREGKNALGDRTVQRQMPWQAHCWLRDPLSISARALCVFGPPPAEGFEPHKRPRLATDRIRGLGRDWGVGCSRFAYAEQWRVAAAPIGKPASLRASNIADRRYAQSLTAGCASLCFSTAPLRTSRRTAQAISLHRVKSVSVWTACQRLTPVLELLSRQRIGPVEVASSHRHRERAERQRDAGRRDGLPPSISSRLPRRCSNSQ
jgi:hypothetical protein